MPLSLAAAFTFQSGSILMLGNMKVTLTDKLLYIPIWFYSNARNAWRIYAYLLFTFQSGSILMIESVLCLCWHPLLYIPIWFYSNHIFFSLLQNCIDLYIPIWFYSNVAMEKACKNDFIFTFQSGSILILPPEYHKFKDF